MKLSSALDVLLTSTGAGDVFAAPMDVHLSPSDVVRPDIFVVLAERTAIIREHGIFGAPDLVIEIVSPSSLSTDYLRKSMLHEQHGVREYWVVNPEVEVVGVQFLEGDRYVYGGEYGRTDTIRSIALEGFTLDLGAIFPETASVINDQQIEETQPTNDSQ